MSGSEQQERADYYSQPRDQEDDSHRQRLVSWQQEQQYQQQQQVQPSYQVSPRLSSRPNTTSTLDPTTSSALRDRDHPSPSGFLKPVQLRPATVRSLSSSSSIGSVEQRDRQTVSMASTLEPQAEAGSSSQYHQKYHPAYLPHPQQQQQQLYQHRIPSPSSSEMRSASAHIMPSWQQQDYRSSTLSTNLPSRTQPPIISSGLVISYSETHPRDTYLSLDPFEAPQYPLQSGPSSAPYIMSSSYDRGRTSPFAVTRSTRETSVGSATTLPSYIDEGVRRSYHQLSSLYPGGISHRYSPMTSDDYSRSPAPLPPLSHQSHLSYAPSHPYMESYMQSGSGMMALPPPNPPLDYTPTTAVKEIQRRAATACNFCRTRKLRCDGSVPCRQCERRQLTCVFQESGLTKRRKRDKDENNEGDRDDEDDPQRQQQQIVGKQKQSSTAFQSGSGSSVEKRSPSRSGGMSSGRRNSNWKLNKEANTSKSPEEADENKRYIWKLNSQAVKKKARRNSLGINPSDQYQINLSNYSENQYQQPVVQTDLFTSVDPFWSGRVTSIA